MKSCFPFWSSSTATPCPPGHRLKNIEHANPCSWRLYRLDGPQGPTALRGAPFSSGGTCWHSGQSRPGPTRAPFEKSPSPTSGSSAANKSSWKQNNQQVVRSCPSKCVPAARHDEPILRMLSTLDLRGTGCNPQVRRWIPPVFYRPSAGTRPVTTCQISAAPQHRHNAPFVNIGAVFLHRRFQKLRHEVQHR